MQQKKSENVTNHVAHPVHKAQSDYEQDITVVL